MRKLSLALSTAIATTCSQKILRAKILSIDTVKPINSSNHEGMRGNDILMVAYDLFFQIYCHDFLCFDLVFFRAIKDLLSERVKEFICALHKIFQLN